VDSDYDLLVIGGGITGAGIARDASGRGLRVALVEAGDLGGATSSASTQLVHGGLRAIDFHHLGLVRKALAERETLLDIAPHISWPQSFILPRVSAQRPEWLQRAGLFLRDRLIRHDTVPRSTRLDLRQDRAGRGLLPQYRAAFRFWDGWVDEARMVMANARDAADRGALVLPRTPVTAAEWDGTIWRVTIAAGRTIAARHIVNASGPWAETVARTILGRADAPTLRLVHGAHIVTRRVQLGSDAFLLPQPDGRTVFVLPYEHEFSLIGTSERTVDSPEAVAITPDESDYLLSAVNRYVVRPLGRGDILHHYAGVRSLVVTTDKAGREMALDDHLVEHDGVPALTVVGGKITTYRLLAEAVLAKVAPKSKRWTAKVPLAGSDVERLGEETGQDAFKRWLVNLTATYENYDPRLIKRLARTLGTAAEPLLAGGLGANLGGIFEAELAYFAANEWAANADDVLWRRTKLGLHLGDAAQARVAAWFGEARPAPAAT